MSRRAFATVVVCGALSAPLLACGGDDGSTARAATSGSAASGATASGDATTTAATERAAARLPAGILGRPTGSTSAGRPRAVVLIFQGGGWAASTKDTVRVASLGTEGYRAEGFATYTAPLAAGAGSLRSAEQAYARMRKRYGAKVPICAFGTSSGGHVALMLAAQRNIACVVANAAPTELAPWLDESPGERSFTERYFGSSAASLRRWSPVAYASRIKARVLLQYAANDEDVPADQGRRFLKVHPRRTQLVVLSAGDQPFAHSNVDGAQLDQVYPRNAALFDQVARAAGR